MPKYFLYVVCVCLFIGHKQIFSHNRHALDGNHLYRPRHIRISYICTSPVIRANVSYHAGLGHDAWLLKMANSAQTNRLLFSRSYQPSECLF